MTDVDLDALDLHDDLEDENYVRIRKDHLEEVRGAAKRSNTYRREAEDLRRDKALTDAGLTDLTDRQRSALTALVKEPTAENFKAEAIGLGFIAAPPPPPEPTAADLEALQRAADVANGAGAAPPVTKVTAADTRSWTPDKRMRLRDRHPDLHEALLRDQDIELPAGFA